MGLLDAIQDKQFRSDVGDNTSNFLRSMSNTVAGNVTGPVDGLAWLLRKAGIPIHDAPQGGSQWARNAGLLTDTAPNASGLAGEMMGLLAPVGMTAGAPKIAKGLLQMADNAMTPQALNKEAGVILYHGSNEPPKAIKAIRDDGLYGGIFASPSRRAASSHILDDGGLYRMTVPDEKVLTQDALEQLPGAREHVLSRLRNVPDEHVDDVVDLVLGRNGDLHRSDVPDLENIFRSDDLAEASWYAQKIRGEIAQRNGYKAVEMPDEHGASYLVLPGIKPRPVIDR